MKHIISACFCYTLKFPQEYYDHRITMRINKKEDFKKLIQLISEMYNLNFEINEELKVITFQ